MVTAERRLPNPYDNASFLSRLTFWWLYPFLIKGCKKSIKQEDLYEVPENDASFKLGELVSSHWDQEVLLAKSAGRKPHFVKALLRAFGKKYAFCGLLGFLDECVCRVAQPIFLIWVIRYFGGDSTVSRTFALFSCSGIAFLSLLRIFIYHPFNFKCRHLTLQIKSGIGATVYRKALRLSAKALKETTIGQMVNLLSNDVNRFDASVIFLHYIWIGPLQTGISTLLLWYEIGPSCLAGILLLLFYVPLQVCMGRVFSKLRLETAQKTDERIRLTNEVVSAIRMIKMYVWENTFSRLVTEARKSELNVILKANCFRTVNMTMFSTSSKIIVFTSLLVYVLTGNGLTAEKVFVTSSLINNIRLAMTLHFPLATSFGSETLVSCRRIQNFLEMEEIEKLRGAPGPWTNPASQECYVDCKEVTAGWDPSVQRDDLRDISLNVKAGETLIIVGPVGSGKSSLVHVLLREIGIQSGSVEVRGKVSYVAQDPWLFAGTVRDNILFGKPFDSSRYSKVLKVCALEKDLQVFPKGDLTTVGDRGISLSGGQKSRISLARATYHDADIYIMDDPLSAVDTHVANHLFEECILDFLKNKVKIVVTHQLQFLEKATSILVMEKGRVEKRGTYAEIKSQGYDFQSIDAKTIQMNNSNTSVSPRDSSDSNSAYESHDEDTQDVDESTNGAMDRKFMSALHPSKSNAHLIDSKASLNVEEKEVKSKVKGSVKFKTYTDYFLAGGGYFRLVVLVFSCIVSQCLFTGIDYFLSIWTNKEQLFKEFANSNNLTVQELMENQELFLDGPLTSEQRINFVYIYSGLTVALIATSFGSSFLYFYVCNRSSFDLHNRMFSALIHAPMSFFETRSIGEILNRFSKDIGHTDDLLPPTMHDFLIVMLNLVAIITVVSFLSAWTLIPTMALYGFFLALRWVYLASARNLKRIEAINRSPVFGHLSSTLEGLTTIRGFGSENLLSSQFDRHQDVHTSPYFLYLASTRIFGGFLDLLSTTYITLVTFSFMAQKDVLSGDVGLGISLAMMLSGMFQWAVRQSAEVENQMTSVERIVEYTQISPESTPESSEQPEYLQIRKDHKRTDKGVITFKGVNLRYIKKEHLALSNLNFTIKAKEKVGIVGRTGAGKSSIVTCLFRLSSPEGEIFIDGIRTDRLPLQSLRGSISIIPQDSTIISGSVRRNVDPLSQSTDEMIWNVLEEVQLKESIEKLPLGLSSPLQEGGVNLSAGQRQLICLARAILKHNNILIMDEPMASVDSETDRIIQRTLHQKFAHCTIITIAHRIQTIMNSDRVMVLDSGKLMEFAAPSDLLQKRDSIFLQLVEDLNPSTGKETQDASGGLSS